MEGKDHDLETSATVTQRGKSTVIDLDIGFKDNNRQSSMLRRSRISRAASETSVRQNIIEVEEPEKASEFGKSFAIAVNEDGCPDRPTDYKCFQNPYLKALFESNRRAIRPLAHRYVTLNFRIMRRNAPMYVGYLLSQKGVRKTDLYKANYLPIWTHCLRIKMRANVKVGIIFHGLKARLGLNSITGLHFCIDGFFGLELYGDAFGNVGTDICPWMELSGNGSPKSLRLKDADNIYVSVATESMRHLVNQRKMRIHRLQPPMTNAVTIDASGRESMKRDRSKGI